MKSYLLSLALFSTALVPSFAADSAVAAEPIQKVEINLGPGLLSFAAKIAAVKDPEAGNLIRGLRNLKTKIYDFAAVSRTSALDQIAGLRKQLVDSTWTAIVTVADKEKNDVSVLVKQGTNDTLQGIVVTVLDQQQQGVVVQIDGELQADQIANLVKHLDIEGMPELHCKQPEKS